jgi:YfiH family protein
VYQIPQLLKYNGLFHAFSEKSDGNMANVINGKVCNPKTVAANRKKFFKRIAIDIKDTICMWVAHGDTILEADPKLAGVSMLDYRKAVKVDGLTTNKNGLYLFLLIADCLPVIIFDPVNLALAAVHAGWKGVDLEISGKAIEFMIDKYNSDPGQVVVGIGPCVYKESFIKANPKQKNDSRWRPYIDKVRPCQKGSESFYSVDLVGFTKKQLIDAGVKKGNIFESEIDTAEDERFFSHVRDANKHISRQGRFACVIALI